MAEEDDYSFVTRKPLGVMVRCERHVWIRGPSASSGHLTMTCRYIGLRATNHHLGFKG